MSNEMEEKLAQIKECPEPCNDGLVTVTLPSGGTMETACPLIGLNRGCAYGEMMEFGLDKYVTDVMSGIGIPLRHVEKIMNARQTETLVEIDKWRTRGFLIFTGSSGSGKSFGAAMALHRYLKNLVPDHFNRVKWGAADRAAGSVVWRAAADMGEDRETTARAKRERLLVIDDLGGEPDIPALRSVLSGVILRRHDMKLPTVITTALTMLDLDMRYGSRVADRLTEDIGLGNGGMIIECGSVSMRSPAVFQAAWEK